MLQHHAGAAGAQAGNILGLGLPLRDAYTLEQLNEHAVVEGLVESDPVLLLDATAGVADALAEAAIVGEDDKTFAVSVQTAYVVGVAVLGRQQVIYGADGALSIAAAYIAARLVEQHHYLLLGGGMAAVHFHKISRQNAQTGGVYCLAVYFHTPFGDQAVSSAARLIAAGCQKLIETHAALGSRRIIIVYGHMLSIVGRSRARVVKKPRGI